MNLSEFLRFLRSRTPFSALYAWALRNDGTDRINKIKGAIFISPAGN
jgi:hypothetical protein